MQNRIFSLRSARLVIFALGAPLLSDFQQSARVCPKERFQPEMSTFCPFRTEHITFQRFSGKCTSLYKTASSAYDQHVFSFHAGTTTFQQFSLKFTSLSKTAFSARGQHVLSFSHWAHHFLTVFSKVNKFLRNSVFCPTSALVVIFALGALVFSDFQQSSRVCPKLRFQ